MRLTLVFVLVFLNGIIFSQPLEEVALNNQAVAMMDSGNYKQAIIYLDRLTNADSTNTIYRYNRAVTLFNLKRYQEALTEYKILSEAMPDESEYLFQTGNAYEQLNNSQQAVHFYSKAIESDADQFLYYFKRGTIFLKENKLKEAEVDFNASLLINPKHHNSLHNRAIARYKLGQLSKACEDWCQSFRLGNSYSESHLKENCKKSQPCIPVK